MNARCWGWLGLVGCVTLSVGCGPPESGSSSEQAETTPAETETVLAGDQAVVFVPGASAAYVAREDAWDEMLEAENAQSHALMDRLTSSGRAVRVPNGTPVLVLKNATFSRMVQVRSGPHEGFEGWIQGEFLAHATPTPKVDPEAVERQRVESEEATKAFVESQAEERSQVESEPVPEPLIWNEAESRAKSRLKIAEALQKQGKPAIAADYYRQIVAEYPDTDAAKTAAQHLAEIEPH